MSERMTEAEFNSLLIRRVNRDGTAERLCSVAHAEITTLRAEVSELNQVFDARWSADMRAIKCWRKDNPGNELVLPDHVNLCLWLMEERTRLAAEVAWHVEDKNKWQDTQAAHLQKVIRLTARVAKLEWACSATQHDIQQTLGKALNYPWYKDDQKNFPNATEADGVCVGDHVAESLADETVTKITALRAENEKLRDVLSGVLWMADEWFNHGGDETAFSDDHAETLEAARAFLSASQPAPSPKGPTSWPNPTPEMLNDPTFNAIWNVIKSWDINVPAEYSGYCGATGNHVLAIWGAILLPPQKEENSND
jgi:hypothetical protein